MPALCVRHRSARLLTEFAVLRTWVLRICARALRLSTMLCIADAPALHAPGTPVRLASKPGSRQEG